MEAYKLGFHAYFSFGFTKLEKAEWKAQKNHNLKTSPSFFGGGKGTNDVFFFWLKFGIFAKVSLKYAFIFFSFFCRPIYLVHWPTEFKFH